MRRSKNRPRAALLLSLRGPLFTLSRADLSPQPPADVRLRRDVVLLHLVAGLRDAPAAAAQHAPGQGTATSG